MESYHLVPEGGPNDAEWVLAWDGATLMLDGPDGQRALEVPLATAHRLVDMYGLYAEDKVRFVTPQNSFAFEMESSAASAVRRLVEVAMAADPEFCADLRGRSLRTIRRGVWTSVVAGGLFGLYCWYASCASDPPLGPWLRLVVWLMHAVLLIVMGAAVAGPLAIFFGLRQLERVERIERLAASSREQSEPATAPE